MYLWRAVDDEGEVLDMLVQERRNKGAAFRLIQKLLKNQGIQAEAIVTDKLPSYRPAAGGLGRTDRHQPGGMRENNRAKKIPSANPSAGAKAAKIQVQGVGTEVFGHPRRCPKCVQPPAPSDPQTDPPPPAS